MHQAARITAGPGIFELATNVCQLLFNVPRDLLLHKREPGGALVLVWRDKAATGHLRIETLGDAPKEIVDADGVLLVKRK